MIVRTRGTAVRRPYEEGARALWGGFGDGLDAA